MNKTKIFTMLLGSSAAALALTSGAASAQQRNFDLPEGRAVDTLPSFALQSGLQIIAPSKKLRHSRTPRLYGAHDARQALKHIIRAPISSSPPTATMSSPCAIAASAPNPARSRP